MFVFTDTTYAGRKQVREFCRDPANEKIPHARIENIIMPRGESIGSVCIGSKLQKKFQQEKNSDGYDKDYSAYQ